MRGFRCQGSVGFRGQGPGTAKDSTVQVKVTIPRRQTAPKAPPQPYTSSSACKNLLRNLSATPASNGGGHLELEITYETLSNGFPGFIGPGFSAGRRCNRAYRAAGARR